MTAPFRLALDELLETLAWRFCWWWVAVRRWVYGTGSPLEAAIALIVVFTMAVSTGQGIAAPQQEKTFRFALETYGALVSAHRRDLLPAVAGLR